MRIRSILSMAASAVAVMALATPSQAADNGTYFIQDGRGACLIPSEGYVDGELGPCGPDTVWQVRNLPDGSVQIASGRDESRCLGLSPVKIFPPQVFVNRCDVSPDRWTITGSTDEGAPVALSLTGYPSLGTLTPRGDRATLAGEGAAEWSFTRVD